MVDSLSLAGEGSGMEDSTTLDGCRSEMENSSLGGWRSEIEGGWRLINENSSLAGKPEMAASSSGCNNRAG